MLFIPILGLLLMTIQGSSSDYNEAIQINSDPIVFFNEVHQSRLPFVDGLTEKKYRYLNYAILGYLYDKHICVMFDPGTAKREVIRISIIKSDEEVVEFLSEQFIASEYCVLIPFSDSEVENENHAKTKRIVVSYAFGADDVLVVLDDS